MLKKKRKSKANKTIYTPICGYCKEYVSTPDYRRKMGGVRECLMLDRKEVDFNTVACEDFKLVDTFHCNVKGQRVYVTVCIHKLQNKKCISTCRQGKLITGLKEIPTGEPQRELRQKDIWGQDGR